MIHEPNEISLGLKSLSGVLKTFRLGRHAGLPKRKGLPLSRQVIPFYIFELLTINQSHPPINISFGKAYRPSE